MMRLGVRIEDEEMVVAPDFSTFGYMLEEYITLATAGIVIPSSSPESRNLGELPPILRKRIRVLDDAAERQAANRILHPLRDELGVKETEDGNDLLFPKEMPRELKHAVRIVHRDLWRLATGFNHNLQVAISPEISRCITRQLRQELSDGNSRAILAQMEGILSTYGEVQFESPKPNLSTPAELIAVFDRLLNDPEYLGFSLAVSELALPQKRRAVLSRVRHCGRRLIANSLVAKGWDCVVKSIAAWTGAPLPASSTLATLISGKDFPILVDLRAARRRAITTWLKTAQTTMPISSSSTSYEGLSWILPARPPDEWDGGDLTVATFGKVSELLTELRRFRDTRS